MTLGSPTSSIRGTLVRTLKRGQDVTRWGLSHAIPRAAITASARRGDLNGLVFLAAQRTQEMPVDLFDRIRATGPFHRGRFAFGTAHLPVVKEVLTSTDVRAGFGTDTRTALGRLAHWAEGPAPIGPLTPPSLLATEPPDHTRMRKLVTRVFSVKAVRELRARAERVADELLDGLSADGNTDLVDRYCAALPVTMICEILGVPASERDRVRDLGTRAAPSLDVGLPYRRFREVDSSLHEFEAWLRTHIERVRRDPGPDLLSQLVAVRDDDGAQLTDSELISTAGLVLAAGFETTVNLIGNAIALLDTHRDQRDLLREGTASWAVAVDEVLRYDPPVFLTGRTATRDTVIAGTPIPKGTLITALLAAANRDPEIFDEPHRFDVTRHNAAEHVAFSAGRHYCLGAALARMEGEVALHKLHERYPDLRVVPGARRRDTRVLRGYAYLPARPK